MMRTSWSIAAVAIAMGVVGCGKSTSGAGGGSTTATGTSTGTGPSATQACTDLEHAACTKRDSCSQNSYLNDIDYGSEAACEMRLVTTCVSALGAKGTGQSPANLESCVAAFPSYPCADFIDNNPPTACQPPMGMGATGAACGASAQCSSGFCQLSPFALCGQCAAVPAVGASCLSAAECGRDLACAKPTGATPTTTGTCAAYVAQGGMCDDTHPCTTGTQCVGLVATMALSGTCQPAATMVGATCDPTRKTMAGCEAVAGLACIPTGTGATMGTCQPITLAAPGATCGAIGKPVKSVVECQAGGLCKKAVTTDATGTCVAPAAEGAPCNVDPTIGPPCLAPSKCVMTSPGGTAGTCTTPDASKCM